MGTRQVRTITHIVLRKEDCCLDCPFYSRGEEPVCLIDISKSLNGGPRWDEPRPWWCKISVGPVVVEVANGD